MRIAAALLLCAAACSVPPAKPTEAVIWAQFDPSTGDVPTPNDLVRDAGAKQIVIPITPDLSPAQAEFDAYLNTLDGFPTSTPALFHFTGSVSPQSLTSKTVAAFQLDAQGNLDPLPIDPARTYSDSDFSYQLYADGGWTPGTTYLIAVRGGPNGVQGANGETVLAAPAFYFLRSDTDLTQHPWAFPGATPAIRAATAAQLEAVRETYEPFIEKVISTASWSRDEVALLFTFTTSTHPELQFDPLSQAIPMPNDLVINPQTHLVSLPPSPTDTPLQATAKAELNQLDGFSTSGIFSAQATGTLDAAHAVGTGNLRLFQLSSGQEVAGVDRWLYNDNEHLFLQPQSKGENDAGSYVPPVVLQPKTTYVWIVTGQEGTSGEPVDAQPVGVLLRMKSSLLDATGHSTVSGIADADAQLIEPLRAEMTPLLDSLELAGLPRAAIEAAVPFTTLDIRGHIQKLVQLPYSENLSTEPDDFQVEKPSDIGVVGGIPTAATALATASLTSVAYIVNGHFDTFDQLDPTTQAFASPGTAHPIAFTFTYPTGFGDGKKPPMVLFGQALTTERRLAWFEANRLAQAGFAVFSFDLPYHGERSSCNVHIPICEVIAGAFGVAVTALPFSCDDTDPASYAALLCGSGVCDADGQCSGGTSDFNTYPLYNFGALLDPNNPGTPFASGGAFINIEDLGASRDHFAQAITDLSAAYRFMLATDWTQMLPDGLDVDKSKVPYTGISLGGILGGAGTGAVPPISTLALNVGGAGLIDLFQESVTFGAVLPPGLAAEGIHLNPGNPAQNDLNAWQFLTVAHWLFDDVDPINVGLFAEQDTQPYTDPNTGVTTAWPNKHVLVQMAGADTIVSNPSTERLRFTIDPACCDNGTYVPLQSSPCSFTSTCQFTTYFGASHIFEVDPLEVVNQGPGQDEVANFLSAY